ncbi:30S ribosomal protein S1 [Maridesulfovibrio hydrothermalis]|uniref:RNA binding S1 domain protein n=1 Tax=Maridesulfovibrio hydrothermalis AM13 = DSM 14728 TaxID=1121451 RepID=L0RA99_9BACT|nr:30S ribosomal protein S1 [Maridesulfovibrio hydrothermalis]CCO22481.1 RNA binding S1 domain protein [Maridesulfovibrio hydrothermalis AM13 = DSM 14728]
MSEKNLETNGEENFAELFEAFQSESNDNLQVGDQIKGTVISITKDSVFIDTGSKVDGVVTRDELTNEEGELTVNDGDIVELYVISMNNNEVVLSKAMSGAGGLNMLREAFENSVPVEGKVEETCKGGFRVKMMHRKVFCPVSQIDTTFVENPEEYVGSTHNFQVIKFEENGRNIVVSRRVLLEQEQEKAREQFMQDVQPDAVLDGRVTKLMPFGAFVELTPGVEGMVHISELSWSRSAKPEDVVQPGDEVTVRILSMEPRKDGKGLKIGLSLKQLQADPWDELGDKFKAGDKTTGTVARCADFGVFVEIAPGIEGLVHISEMSYTKRVHKPEDEVTPGQEVAVMIKDVDPVKRRIGLSMKDAAGDPWLDVEDTFKVGQEVEGTVENKAEFGIFINLAPGITGLLPMSRISRSGKQSELESLKPGDKVKVSIEELNTSDRKVTLTAGDAKKETGDSDWKEYNKTTASRRSAPRKSAAKTSGDTGGFGGLLGQKLQEAMNKKN